MNVTVLKEDKIVVVDGIAINFDFAIADNIWAIQWDGTKGEVEYVDSTPNTELTDFSAYQYLVDGYSTEKQRLLDVTTQEDLDAEATLTYADRRKDEYDELNQFEMQFDDSLNGTTTWTDAIKAIKDKYPKA